MREVLRTIKSNSLSYPHRLAIVLPGTQITYGLLWKRISIAWTRIDALAFDREKPVVLLVDNPILHTIVRLALISAGYCVATIRPEHIPIIRELNAEVFFHDGPIRVPYLQNVLVEESWFDGEDRSFDFHENLRPNRIGRILFSSGSTGTPKAIGMTNETFEDTVKMGLSPSDRSLSLYGLSTNVAIMLRALFQGSTISFSRPEDVAAICRKYRIQELFGSPSQILSVLDSCRAKQIRLKFERISLGSAPFSADLGDKIQAAFDCSLRHVYNSSEATFIAIAAGELINQRKSRGNCFTPISDIRILDEDGLPVPRGKVGRVEVTSRRVSSLFDGALERSGNETSSRSFLSNDIGKIDPDGVLILLGRADEVINFGGAKFSPEILEEVFKRHPLISDAGVVLVRSGDTEQVWLALVTPKGIDLAMLNQWIAKNSSGEMQAMRFDQCFLVDQIPRGFNGKVLRQELRGKLAALRNQVHTGGS